MVVATMAVAETTHLQEVVETLVVMRVEAATPAEETPTHLLVEEMTQEAETQVVEMLEVGMLTHLLEGTMPVVTPLEVTWVAMPVPKVVTKPPANQLQTMQ